MPKWVFTAGDRVVKSSFSSRSKMCIRDRYKGSWYYLGSDGAMVKGLQTIGGKWYYMDTEGRMATKPVVLTPDQNGALKYPGLSQ